MKRAKIFDDFIAKSLDEKLEYIKEAWEKKYPELFKERGFFEKIMGEYRYKKADGAGLIPQILQIISKVWIFIKIL